MNNPTKTLRLMALFHIIKHDRKMRESSKQTWPLKKGTIVASFTVASKTCPLLLTA
jgi:hypothetical protein